MPKSFGLIVVTLAASGLLLSSAVRATAPHPDPSIRRFLAQGDVPHSYRAHRLLEAENGDRRGWMHVETAFSSPGGLRYEITGEGGSSFIRSRILRAVLDGERDMVAQGEMARSALVESNYIFSARGVDDEGLANVLLSPRRKDSVLIAGTLFLQPADGNPVRVEGRLSKSPSFWAKNVDIVRCYSTIGGTVMPVSLESTAEIRWFGPASLRMTYAYSEIDGRSVDDSRR